MNVAPILETKRLRLRAHRREDFEALAAMWACPEVVRYIGGEPFGHQASWSRLVRYAGMWSISGYGFWAIEERDTGRFVGEAGFIESHRDALPQWHGLPEAGWCLVEDVHGRGYGKESLEAICSWGDEHFPLGTQTVCMIESGNIASRKLAEGAGFMETGRTMIGKDELILFQRERGETR
ncbi:MAG TPA: GNAT family N-acetyltransferase [Myxococcales bacterium]|nr:GNAT family N-acetyltransferase [Deltaproteobacteria bacterium]MBU53542.1 GNAT family N-acetyltransferase [Deltaproteobacteria bacterium]HAA56045.1 GNAT family N-acetyltransferase [Myxococcales bacterium]|tara:strand:- start:3035 stop:3574 length:540 start_codon:yes stop_codon:yes gene_type:complete